MRNIVYIQCCITQSIVKNRMVLLHEVISGRAHILILGQKEVKSHKEISLFCDLNSIYGRIDLKLWIIK
jgi:hypothetical protein